jgi:uncharacterized protein YegL
MAENDSKPPINVGEPHMACLFLVDTSGSMDGQPIAQLNAGLERFKFDVAGDEKTRRILDVAIVEFNDGVNVVQGFVPIEDMLPVDLTADGSTNMRPAIEMGMLMVQERSKVYYNTGTVPYKPWIILISDGVPDDPIDGIAQTVRDQEAKEKLKFWCLGVEGFDESTLKKLAPEKTFLLNGYNFAGFFDWVHKSLKAVSESSPGQRVDVQLPSPGVMTLKS